MINKVTLLGRLGRDPEIRSTRNGAKVASFGLATSETWKDRNTGERREQTEWHNVVVWNEGLVTVAEKYLRKGSLVYLEGRLETRKWQDQNGQDRYSTEVVLRSFGSVLKLMPRGDGRGDDDDRRSSNGRDDRGSRDDRGDRRGGGYGSRQQSSYNDLDDDIPF